MLITQAVTDEHVAHDLHLRSLAKALRLFGDARDYIYLQRKRRLSTGMLNDTVSIFSELADLFITLLGSGLAPERKSKSFYSWQG